jgi:hypothetical protein
VPRGLLEIFKTILYENEFQNPQVFHQHLRFSPERSTLAGREMSKAKMMTMYVYVAASAYAKRGNRLSNI